MDTVCGHCGAGLDTPYVLLGAAAECPSCGARAIPRVPDGTRYPPTGYEITFADFQRLISDPYCTPSVAPLLRSWFGYELAPSGEVARVLSTSGEEVDPLSLHLSIQADGPRQSALYRTAMTLWR